MEGGGGVGGVKAHHRHLPIEGEGEVAPALETRGVERSLHREREGRVGALVSDDNGLMESGGEGDERQGVGGGARGEVVVIWSGVEVIVEVDIEVAGGGDVGPAILRHMQVRWRVSVSVRSDDNELQR
jgi:hypothetical protein